MADVADIIQISDLHLVEKITNHGRAFYARHLPKAAPHAFAKIVSLSRAFHRLQDTHQCDFVLATGDLTTDGSVGALRTAKEFIESDEITRGGRTAVLGLGLRNNRRILVPGNHDRFTRSWIGFQVPSHRFEQELRTPRRYPYVVGFRKPGTSNDPSMAAILFFVFDSTPSVFAELCPHHRVARGRLEPGDCDRFLKLARDVQNTGRVQGLDGKSMCVRYSNCVRVVALHHHPFDTRSTTLLENSDEFRRCCFEAGVHLALFGHEHEEYYAMQIGASNMCSDTYHKVVYLCCPSASVYNSRHGFYHFHFDTSGFRHTYFRWDDRELAFIVGSLDIDSSFQRGVCTRHDFSKPLQ